MTQKYFGRSHTPTLPILSDDQILIPNLPPIPTIVFIVGLVVLILIAALAGGVIGRLPVLRRLREEKSQHGSERRRLSTDLASANSQLEIVRTELKAESADAQRYWQVREKLQASSVIRNYVQPVILLGPRYVGKTSLLNQLHSPWRYQATEPTATHRWSIIPFFDSDTSRREEHFADDQIIVDVRAHLQLKVHDFPGELGSQSRILALAASETELLRRELRFDLGVVVVCMLDAEEAITGIQDSTRAYFTGEFFAKLRELVSVRNIFIQRLIIVYNKLDLAKNRNPSATDESLLGSCRNEFEELLRPFSFIVNGERVCDVGTILRHDGRTSNQGATVVMGEAAVGLVEALFGRAEVGRIVPDRASSGVSALWPGML